MATVNKSRIKTDKNGRDYIVVIYGDTLSEIAEAYFGDHTKYPQLAAINKLEDANRIVVGQTIYLNEVSSGSTSSPAPANTRSVTITQFGLLAGGVTNELYATWTWSKEGDTQEYDIEWKWYRAGVWKYSDSTEIRRASTFTIPDDGITSKIQFRVRPVPKVDTVNNKEVSRFATDLWTDWNECTYNVINKPDIPSGLSVELNDLSLTATVSNVDKTKASTVEFKCVKDGSESGASTKIVGLDDTGSASYTFKVEAGSSYKVCCRSYKNDVASEWSAYSSSYETKPAKVEITEGPIATSTTSIYLAWSKANTASDTNKITYILAYTNNEKGFYEGDDGKGTEVTTEALNYTVDGLSLGAAYQFRVKAKNSDNQESEWSEVKTLTIGSSPTVPTTWSSTTTAIAGEGETVSLYWVHNSTDNSTQKSAIVTLTFTGMTDSDIAQVVNDASVDEDRASISNRTIKDNIATITVESKSTEKPDLSTTYALILDTKNFSDGAIITWTVSTMGITGEASSPSMDREVCIYTMPTIFMHIKDSGDLAVGTIYYKVDYLAESDVYQRTDETIESIDGTPVANKFTVTGEQVRTATVNGATIYYCVKENESLRAFPFKVNVEVDTTTEIQSPIEYHLTISANDAYETVDNFGNQKTVAPEEILYSKHFSADSADPTKRTTEISAQDVSLSNGQSYTVKCVVAMSSGILVEAYSKIHISWSSEPYALYAEIAVDRTDCSVSIRPYCEVNSTVFYKVTYTSGKYVTDTSTKYSYVYGSVMSNMSTTTGDQLYYGTTPSGTQTYYTIRNSSTAIKNLWFGVYRREYDGTFTEIISGLDAEKNSFVPDPHPSLDYARYRITAKDKLTGIISYADIANHYIGEKAIILQWNEPHTSYTVSEDELGVSNRSETFLRLPYNIDVTNSRDPDVSLIKYIGRKHPVSYYGTQMGEKASWSTEVPKTDTETLYTLQRLQAWSGDVYVREPYGTGYWANVKVSMSRTHLETVVPVTLDITRVEGGI